jgi:hypothetical protein
MVLSSRKNTLYLATGSVTSDASFFVVVVVVVVVVFVIFAVVDLLRVPRLQVTQS